MSHLAAVPFAAGADGLQEVCGLRRARGGWFPRGRGEGWAVRCEWYALVGRNAMATNVVAYPSCRAALPPVPREQLCCVGVLQVSPGPMSARRVRPPGWS